MEQEIIYHIAQESSWVDVLSALLTPVIAILAAYIAYAQYRINKTRLQFETYEHKKEIYNSTKEFAGNLFSKGTLLSINDWLTYRSAIVDRDFLFSQNVNIFLKDILDKSFEVINLVANNYDDLPVGAERSARAKQASSNLKELIKLLQNDNLVRVFKDDLKII
jgi:hypothetical protein